MANQKRALKKNKMTLDKLALITQNGFVELEDKLDKKIETAKTELRGEMGDLKTELRGEMRDLKIELRGAIDKLGGETRKGIDRMLTVADKMAGQFNIWQEENAVGAAQTGDLRYQVDDHEKRIVKIEQKLEA